MSFLINQHVTAGTKLNSFLSKSSAWFKCYAATFCSNLNSSLSNEHPFLQHGFHDQNTLLWNLYRETRHSFELHEFVHSELGQPAVGIHIYCFQFRSTDEGGKYVVISAEVNHSLVLPKQLLLLTPVNLLLTLSFRLCWQRTDQRSGSTPHFETMRSDEHCAAEAPSIQAWGGNPFSVFG